MTIVEARSIYLSFKGATEGEHHGHPDFRIGNRIFATLLPDKDLAVLRLPQEFAEALVVEHPSGRRVVARSGGMGWLAVEVDTITADEFLPLVQVAFESRS